MSGIGGWLGTGAAVVVIGLCLLLMRFGHRLPSVSHPWQHRAVIVLMYAAGAALLVTTGGSWVLHTLGSLGGWIGGTAPGSGIGWALVTIGALFLLASVVADLIWQPNATAAYRAAVTPLALALATGGVAAQIYAFTAYPAQQLVLQIGHWAGG